MGKEYPHPGENVWIERLRDRLQTQMAKDYPTGRMLRDAHPKQHGCLRAEFDVEPNLPPELAVGVFARPASYAAWIRYSNSFPVTRPDRKWGIRGMALKLTEVPDAPSGEQDFLLLTRPAFIAKDVPEFDSLVEGFNGGLLAKLNFAFNPFRPHLRLIWRAVTSARPCANLLMTRYWSATPYRLGVSAVKYSTFPELSTGLSDVHPSSPDYLRERLADDLRRGEARFTFCVQTQTDPVLMPIEDATARWSEKRSPFRKVATIRIPKQDFDTPEQQDFGDNLSFTPWNCLPEHQPLGGINRGRKEIYAALSKFRHERNAMPS